MTLFIQASDLTSSTLLTTTTLPGAGDGLYVLSGVSVTNTKDFGIAIGGSAASQQVLLAGNAFGYHGIRLDGINAQISVSASGSASGAYAGIYASGDTAAISVSGAVDSGRYGIICTGANVSITNTGTVSGIAGGISVSGASLLLNSGTIAVAGPLNFSAAAFSGSLVTDQVYNGGTMVGTVFMGGGDDLYDGTGGKVVGLIDLSSGNDTCIGGDGAERIDDGTGTDDIEGWGGNDLLVANSDGAEDTFDGGDGTDTISFARDFGVGVTANLASGLAVGDLSGVLIFTGVERLVGSNGADSFTGDSAANTLLGGNGNDTLSGDRGNDRLAGGNGIDTLLGGDGTDRLLGSAGADSIDGGLGNDLIFGGLDVDRMAGGGGSDRFVFTTFTDFVSSGLGTTDRITDFTQGQDVIDLSLLDADSTAAGDQAFTFVGSGPSTGPGQIVVRQGGGNTFIDIVDFTGTTLNDIRLDGLITLTAADFAL